MKTLILSLLLCYLALGLLAHRNQFHNRDLRFVPSFAKFILSPHKWF